ncbi:unnamed protein product [Rotaria sp. Silwood1]|nr:unnamed protein product [Rotaria sp. Silwood1]CAF4981075.1 unnamed protein product [Rotaria sp. Silwood1]
MLSQREYEDLNWKLTHIPATITGRPQQNLRTTLRKKIHEHELASTYPPFTPSNFQQFFINFQTTDLTLLHLIEACAASTNFILDTESVCIYQRPNKPALIQIQIILPTSISYVLIIEVCHLPPIHETTFQLIKQFFTTLFSPGKTIYIWGEIDELNDFTTTGLFTLDQITLSNNNNFQDEFKDYWTKKHPHEARLQRSTNELPCQCESCLGINPTDAWSLQNAVAYALNQCFDIGLDPQLYHFNINEIAHRTTLTNYAIFDCLSIYQLLIKLNLINIPQQSSITSTISIDEDSIEVQQTLMDYDQISSDESEPERESQQQRTVIISDNPTISNTNEHQQHHSLTEEERKKIHNRSCTLKQRKKLYKYEIIRRGIDRRFTITQIKKILRERSINFGALNISTSTLTNRTSLYIGINDQTLLSKYERQTRNLFSTDHYDEIRSQQRRSNSNFNYTHRFQHHR